MINARWIIKDSTIKKPLSIYSGPMRVVLKDDEIHKDFLINEISIKVSQRLHIDCVGK